MVKNSMKRRVLVLLVIVLLAALSYAALDISAYEKHVNESADLNQTSNSSSNQSVVIPLERPPFLEEEKT